MEQRSKSDRMVANDELLQAIRACCRDQASYQRLIDLLEASDFQALTPILNQERSSQTRYTAMLNLMPDRVFRVNRNGDNLDFKGTQDDTDHGMVPETIIGFNLQQFLPPDIARQCLQAIAQALDTGILQTFEYQIPKAWEPNQGELQDYEVRLVVCGENEVLAIERDITDRKRSETALRLSEEQNRAFVNAIPDLMFRIRRDGLYLDARADNSSDLALSPSQMIGKTVYDMLPPAIAQQRMHYVEQALQTNSIQIFEYPLEVRGEIRDYEGRIVVSGKDEVLAIMRDITERKRSERQLQESSDRQAALYQQVQALNANLEQQVQERTAQLQQNMQELQELSALKDEFLHAVSHDLRTPMMGMRLVLKNLQNKPDDPLPLSKSILERMAQSIDRQLAMIGSLLEAHSSDVRGISLHYEPVNLGDLVQAIGEDIEPLLLQNQATLSNHISTTLPAVMIDPTQIQRVFENLLTNALQHNAPGLQLTLQAEVEEDEHLIRCQVQDSGVGMTQSECDSLFDRYSRGAHARRSTGIGLGLYLCRQIITAHGGQIGAISSPNAGATFWFTLPLAMG